MRSRLIKLTGAIAAISALGLGGTALAASASNGAQTSTPLVSPAPTQSHQANQPAQSPSNGVANGKVQQGSQTSPDPAGGESTVEPSNGVDTGNVQQGDQTTADHNGAGETQEGVESSQSDGPGGHADATPNANTQQTGQH